MQTGLNCEYDGFSEVILSFSHSRELCKRRTACISETFKIQQAEGSGCKQKQDNEYQKFDLCLMQGAVLWSHVFYSCVFPELLM